MPAHEPINYLEFPSRDLQATKAFFEKCFGWKFTDYGPDYADCSDAGVSFGVYRADLRSETSRGGALIVLYSDQLEQTQQKIESCGGTIVKPIFSFPGGRRFEFTEPCGSEFAVWSHQEAK